MNTTHDTGDRTIGQWLALIIGIAFVAAGLAGFLVTGFDNFASETDKTLLGLEVNPLHNIVHLVLGALGLALWRTRDGARAYGWITFVGYGLVFLYGLFAVNQDSDMNFLSLNTADNLFHLATTLGGLATALLSHRTAGAGSGYRREMHGTA